MTDIEARFSIKRPGFTLDVNLNIPARGITALFGPSGCGKTTLLRAIAGLERHPGAYLKIGDMLWQAGNQFVPPHLRALAYVFQEASLLPHLNVKQNIEYGYKRLPPSQRNIAIDQVIEFLDIEDLLDRKSHTLSGGERQRVAIARALAVSPRLLLMDEPLAALDHERKQEIFPYLESLHQTLDIPVIYVSHSPEEVARLADTVVLLDAGRVIASGTIHEMLTRLDLSLAHGSDAAAIIEATVVAHDKEYDLTYLEFIGGRISAPYQSLPIDSTVRVRIAARDVSLTLQHQTDTSILNIFPAVVESIVNEGTAQVIVRVLANDVPLLAKITRKSAALLDLHAGKRIYAQAKSVALLS